MAPLPLVVAGALLWAGGIVALVAGVWGTSRPPGPPSRLSSLARRAVSGGGRSARRRRAYRAWLAAGALAGVLAWLVTGLPVAGLLVLVAVPGAPWLLRVGADERAAIARIEAVGEWARRCKDITVIGTGLQQAIVASAAGAPAGIAPEVRDLAARLQAGVDARTALLRFADDIADPVCDQVVAALLLHLSDRGDRLGDVLASIAAAAGAEAATRREVDAKRAQSRFGVRFLTGATVLTLGYGILRPSYLHPYATPGGQVVMAVLGCVFAGILLWVRSMSRPERMPRFLVAPDAGTAGEAS